MLRKLEIVKSETILEETHLTISYQSELDILVAVWKGRQTFSGIKEAGQIMIKELESRSCVKVLNDNLEVTSAWPGAVDWVAKEWTPKVVEAGLKKFAWIYAREIIANMSSNRAVSEMDKQYRDKFHFFAKKEEALDWLLFHD